MSNVLMISAIVMLILLFLKVPVYIAVLGGSMVYFVMNPDINSVVFAQQAIIGTEKISLMAIPFFICAGIFMNYTGVTKRIMDFCEVVTGRLPGGLAQVNVLLSTVMGGLSGSNIADAAMESKMMILVGVISKKRGYGILSTEKLTWTRFWTALKPAILPLLLPIIIIGGIRIGIFTATEAGAVAILYAAFLGILYREMHVKDMVQGLKETVASTASIMLIVSAASVFSWILTKERIPQTLTAWMLANIHSKYVFLIVVNIFLLIVGMFIEGNASMIILVPLLAPIAAQYGINEIQFAMIYIFNNAIGALSPPMGTLMFVTCSITKCKTAAFIKEAVPFYILLVVNLLLLTWFEPFTTFLVNLFY